MKYSNIMKSIKKSLSTFFKQSKEVEYVPSYLEMSTYITKFMIDIFYGPIENGQPEGKYGYFHAGTEIVDFRSRIVSVILYSKEKLINKFIIYLDDNGLTVYPNGNTSYGDDIHHNMDFVKKVLQDYSDQEMDLDSFISIYGIDPLGFSSLKDQEKIIKIFYELKTMYQ